MIQEKLDEILAQLIDAKQRVEFEIGELPAGKLSHSRSKGYDRFYVTTYENGNRIRKGITKNKQLVCTLARKELLIRTAAALEQNITVVQHARNAYRPYDPKAIASQLSASFKGLPMECFFHDTADAVMLDLDSTDAGRILSHSEWGKKPYEMGDFMPFGKDVITSKGERMRSKAEVMIAEKLYEYGIPFRYEQVLRMPNGRTLCPDFTFEGAGGGEFYLEFCGMMDDEGYVRRHMQKKSLYQACGIVPWKNIIYLYSSGNEMNMMRIESLVRTQIIPWL